MKPTPPQLTRLADELWAVMRQVRGTPRFWDSLPPELQRTAYATMFLREKAEFWRRAQSILARFPA